MRALTYIDGLWHEGNPPLMGPLTHASWLSSVVFDGARAFEGCIPDLDKHCERVVQSARCLGLERTSSAARAAGSGTSSWPASRRCCWTAGQAATTKSTLRSATG